MFNNSKKLLRYHEFTIPFTAYRDGELEREDFLDIILELKEIQYQQHDSLLDSLEQDDDLRKKHPRLYEALTETVRHFDEAIEITEQALNGDPEDEEEHFEIALETFKKGNLLLADAYYDLDEMMERSNLQGNI